MRILMQLLESLFSPDRRRGATQEVDPHVWLRALIVLLIVVLSGPEIFAAADLIALLDLMGTMLFLFAFAAGLRALGPVALSWLRRLFVPAEWAALLKARKCPAFVAQGLMFIGANALLLTLLCLLSIVSAVEMVKSVA
jgi:hypothetical protein